LIAADSGADESRTSSEKYKSPSWERGLCRFFVNNSDSVGGCNPLTCSCLY
jgi:hypothetical protein